MDALSLYVKAFAVEAATWASGEMTEEEIRRRAEQIARYIATLPPERFTHLRAAGPLFNAETATERFEFGLCLLIRGLTEQAENAERPASHGW